MESLIQPNEFPIWYSYRIVGIIEHGKDEMEALQKARKILSEFLRWEIIDSYSTFEEKDTWKEDHWAYDWSHLPAVVIASSPEGSHFIEMQYQHTTEKFRTFFEEIKLLMQYLTPEILMDDAPPPYVSKDIEDRLRHLIVINYFHELSECPRGHFWYLYHEYHAIKGRYDLRCALKTPEGLNTYVIPAYLHY
jgi:hypothetical protein